MSSGSQTRRGNNRKPRSLDGRQEVTNDLKPIDKSIFGMDASRRAVTASERMVAPKVKNPGGRAGNRNGEGSMVDRRPIEATGHSGGVVSDGTATRTH